MFPENTGKPSISFRTIYRLILFWVALTGCVGDNDTKEVLLGRSVLDQDKKSTCEHFAERHEGVFSDSVHSRICIVPEGGLHGIRMDDSSESARAQHGVSRHSGREWSIGGRLKMRDDELRSRAATESSGKLARDKRRTVNLDDLIGAVLGSNGTSKMGAGRSADPNDKFVNETNNLSLFRQGLLGYQERKMSKYFLFDVSNKKYSSKVVYPENVISGSSAYNYLANYVDVYEISKVSSPTVVSWPHNHIIFVHSQVGSDGMFKFVVYTTSGQVGFYFEVVNNAYKTGCGSYSRTDKTKFTHGKNSLIQVQLVRRKFGFNVFVDGARRTKLDIIDCISSPPTKVEITSGQGSQIYPKVEDCQVSQWTDWSACSKTCLTGSKVRYRSVIMPSMNGGVPCPNLIDAAACNVDITCSPCQYSDWTLWSECSATCGSGSTVRTRELLRANMFTDVCIETFQVKHCKGVSCATDCVVTEWSDWSDCSASCNTGGQFSTRSVIQPEKNGGMCKFELSRTQECNVSVCRKPCDPNPCLNSGTCAELPMSNFICTCLPFYYGETCNSFELPWWFYHVFITLIVLVIGILYKFLFSNIVSRNTMDPSYGGSGDGQGFSQGPAPPPPGTQNQQYYQNTNNYYGYGYYNNTNANEGYLANNGEGNWMY